MDKKPVTVLGSIAVLGTTEVGRKSKESKGVKELVDAPWMARMYNDNMGGVDQGDGTKLQYGMERVIITRKPWLKLFIGLLDMALANSWIVYSCRKKATKTHLEFLKTLIDELIVYANENETVKRSNIKKRAAHERKSLSAEWIISSHCVLKQLPLTTTGNRGQKDCIVCKRTAPKARKRTGYFCFGCDLPVCQVPCFGLLHSPQHVDLIRKAHGKSKVAKR